MTPPTRRYHCTIRLDCGRRDQRSGESGVGRGASVHGNARSSSVLSSSSVCDELGRRTTVHAAAAEMDAWVRIDCCTPPRRPGRGSLQNVAVSEQKHNDYAGHTCVGQNCIRQRCLRHTYIGHTYVGQNYVDHNFTGRFRAGTRMKHTSALPRLHAITISFQA